VFEHQTTAEMFGASAAPVVEMVEVRTSQDTSGLVEYKMMTVAQKTAEAATVVVGSACFPFLPTEKTKTK